MRVYKKRPMTIWAHQFAEGDKYYDADPAAQILKDEAEGYSYVQAESGRWKLIPGVWIVKGMSGSIYVCPDEDFQRIYEIDEP
jgi:hypothetical protein